MRRNDFNHSSNIFLGENALTAIEKEVCYDTREKAELRAEYSARIAENQRYLGLVKEPSKRAYFAVLPVPKAYRELVTEQPQTTPVPVTEESQETGDNSQIDFLKRCHSIPCEHYDGITELDNVVSLPLKCPHCGSQNYSKNGSYKGRKRYKCKDCDKTFYGVQHNE